MAITKDAANMIQQTRIEVHSALPAWKGYS
jgi:hypothetical protein